MEDFTIIIPTLNERATITKLIGELRSLYPSARIIVSDDGSNDGTRETVRRIGRRDGKVLLLDRERREVHGLTASVLDALRLAKTEFVVVMDGDMQHPPEVVGSLAGQLAGGADVAVAYRAGVDGGWPLERRAMSKGAEILGASLLAIRGAPSCRDVLSGFFAARTTLFKEAVGKHPQRFELKGYKVLLDLLKTLPRRTVIAEVPYVFGLRRAGDSKIGPRHVAAFLRSLVR